MTEISGHLGEVKSNIDLELSSAEIDSLTFVHKSANFDGCSGHSLSATLIFVSFMFGPQEHI